MRTKILSLIILIAVVFSFAGCGQTEKQVFSEIPAQEPVTDSNGSLTAVTTAGGYEIPLTELAHQTGNDTDSKVYYTSAISSDALMKIYEALGRTPADATNLSGSNSYDI